MRNKSIRYASKPSEAFLLKRMEKEKANGYIKRGTFTNEIVWGSYSYIMPCMGKRSQAAFKKGMFLFGMVRSDAKRYLHKNPIIQLPKKYAQIEYNGRLDEALLGKVTGTDLNHAYWRIALNLKIISERTYEKGLDNRFKSVRLAALSTLGANKKYLKIRHGEITKEVYLIKGDELLQKVYSLIRLTCYKYMAQIKKMLGSDFLAYKTDCIYYCDTKENRQLVRNFFKEKDLQMKQLV